MTLTSKVLTLRLARFKEAVQDTFINLHPEQLKVESDHNFFPWPFSCNLNYSSLLGFKKAIIDFFLPNSNQTKYHKRYVLVSGVPFWICLHNQSSI